MSERRLVRDATANDGAACARIYRPFVTDTTVSFELDPPDATEMGHRISRTGGTHAFLVLEDDYEVVGYAYGGPFKDRAAYRFSCEVSIYLASSVHGTGGGRVLWGRCSRGSRREGSTWRPPG